MSDDLMWNQFCWLGEMISDGLADEPDGAWIRKEYRQMAIALGIAKPSDFRKPRKNHNKQINDFMAERLKIAVCKKCGGKLKQTRSGSLRGKCEKCNLIYVLGKIKRKKNELKRN